MVPVLSYTTVGWLKVRLSRSAGLGRSPESSDTAPAAATTARLTAAPAASTTISANDRRIRPSRARCGVPLAEARRAAMRARVRDETAIGARPEDSLREEPVMDASTSDAARPHQRLEEAEVLDLADRPAAP